MACEILSPIIFTSNPRKPLKNITAAMVENNNKPSRLDEVIPTIKMRNVARMIRQIIPNKFDPAWRVSAIPIGLILLMFESGFAFSKPIVMPSVINLEINPMIPTKKSNDPITVNNNAEMILFEFKAMR